MCQRPQPSVAKRYGGRLSHVLVRMDSSEETRTVACSSGVQQGGAKGPVMVCLRLRPQAEAFPR